MIPSRTIWGWAQKPFCVPHFLITENKLQAPWPSLSSNEQVQIVANQGREGMQRQEKSRQETIVEPWGRVLVSHQRIYIAISLSYFADTETSTRWEKLTVCCPQAHRPQTCWNQKVGDADSQLPRHQPIRRMSTSWWCPLWTITIKLLTTPSRSGHTVLRALPYSGPLCLTMQ